MLLQIKHVNLWILFPHFIFGLKLQQALVCVSSPPRRTHENKFGAAGDGTQIFMIGIMGYDF